MQDPHWISGDWWLVSMECVGDPVAVPDDNVLLDILPIDLDDS
jgi:hypothetical protein